MTVNRRRTTTQKTKVSKNRASNRACATMACKISKCRSVIDSCKSMVTLDKYAEKLEERYERVLERLAGAVTSKKSDLFIARIIEELYPLSIALDAAQRKHAAMKKSCVHGNPKGDLCKTNVFTGGSNTIGGRAKTSRLLARRSNRAKPNVTTNPNTNNNRRRRILNAIAKRSK